MVSVTRATYKLIKDEFLFVPRGILDVKGRGKMGKGFLERRTAYNGDRA